MKLILELMRLFHYMVGITAPGPKDERKILFVWIGSAVAILLLGIGFAFLIVPFIYHSR